MSIWSDAADLCAASYGGWNWSASGAAFAETDGVWWAVLNYVELSWVVFRGSETFEKDGSLKDVAEDWARDFLALPEHPFLHHEKLGFIHAGFYAGMENAYAEIRKHIQGDVTYVTGHSLGAARATIFTGMLRLDYPSMSVHRIVFGEPNEAFVGGNTGLLEIVSDHWVSNYSFQNTCPSQGFCDPVTLVPPAPYKAPTERIKVVSGLVPTSLPDTAKLHSITEYQKAVLRYGPT